MFVQDNWQDNGQGFLGFICYVMHRIIGMGSKGFIFYFLYRIIGRVAGFDQQMPQLHPFVGGHIRLYIPIFHPIMTEQHDIQDCSMLHSFPELHCTPIIPSYLHSDQPPIPIELYIPSHLSNIPFQLTTSHLS